MADPAAPRQNVTFPSDGGQAHGYLALPPAGSGPGLVVIQERRGLTGHITAIVDRFAAEGFVVLAPALPDPAERAMGELRAAVDFLLGHPALTGDALAVVGLDLGGGLALRLAALEGDRVAAVVPFYGLPAEPDYDYQGLTAHVLGHFAERDDELPIATVDEAAIRIGEATDRRPEIHFYPAGHAFMKEQDGPGDYDQLQARIAWQRTLSFLRGHLG